ncbi:MAG: hypothetical protein KA210_03010 [Bacteroidia bacterium]|nr:hypothetical protein [Bacteroidia bacterium]
MNRLIIIGNGFDLSYGLESSYQHFLKYYIDKCYKEYRIDTNLFSINSNNSEIKSISKFSEDNKFEFISDKIRFFEDLSIFLTPKGPLSIDLKENLQTNNWVDVEALYFKCIIRLLDQFKKVLNQSNKDRYNEFLASLKQINSEFKVLTDEFISYLKNQLISDNLDLNNEIKKLLFYDIGSFVLGQNITSNCLILNFNYTKIINQIIASQQFVHSINIHGSLDEESNPIIFGYGDYFHENYKDIENLNIPEYLRFIKSMEYPKTGNYKTLLNFLDNGLVPLDISDYDRKSILEFEVLIYGHSCGLSDRILLKQIFEHKNCKQIYVAFHNNIDDYFNKTIEISRHFDKKDEFLKKLQPFNEFLKIPQFSDYPLKDSEKQTSEIN